MKRILLFFCHICGFIVAGGQTYWKLDLQDEWRASDVNWNNFQQSNSIITAGKVSRFNLIKSDGRPSTVGVTFISGFTNNSTTAMQGSDNGVFVDLIENHGWYFSSGAHFRFMGLNNSKYYTIYILAASWNYEGGTTSFTVGSNTSNSISTANNVGDHSVFPNWENDAALNKMLNIAPVNGNIDVKMNLTGYGAIEAIVLKEQTAFWAPTNPAAPTSGIVNDNANTFDFTLNPAYGLLSQYDYTLDSGYTWHTLFRKPLVINNVSIKKAYVGVRVKDINGNGAGFPLWSNAGYTITTPTPTPSIIIIKAVLNGTPVWTSKLVPAGLKYNKHGRFGMTMDDRGLTALDLGAYISGGTAQGNGRTYAGKTFTDGANVKDRNIKWSASLASNAYATDTTTDATAGGYAMTWAQANTLIQKNWNLLDHGAWHGIQGGGYSASIGITNTLMNSAQNRNYSYRKLLEQGSEYVMRYGVVPSNDKDYHAAWEQLGYDGGSSQGTYDGYPHQYGANNVTSWLNNRSYKVHLRYFSDLTSNAQFTDRSQWLDAINNVTSLSNSTTHYSSEIGMHTVSIDSVITMMNYAATTFGDNIWVCGLQEFSEYFEVAQTTNIKQRISGDTLIVTLDQTYLNPEIRWRDMSFLLSSDRNISSVTVTGADDYSYNTTTGLINIYKKKTRGYSVPNDAYSTGFALSGKVPLKPGDIYIDNNYDNPPSILIDGDTTTLYQPKTSGSFMYSPYEAIVDLQDWGVVIDSVRVRVLNSSGYETKVILTRNDNEAEDSIGVFTGATQARWLTFYPDTNNRFVSSRVILRSNRTTGFGTEVRVYGSYLPYGIEQTFTHRGTPLKYQLGANTHWWYFTNNVTGNYVSTVFAKLDTLKLYSIRNYGDTWNYQNETGSQWSFEPVQQGWREEQMVTHLKKFVPDMKYFSVMQGQPRSVIASWHKHDSSQMMKAVVTQLTSLGYGYSLKAKVYWTYGSGVMGRAWINPLSGNGIEENSDNWQPIPTAGELPVVLTWGIPNAHGYHVGDTLLFTTRHVSTLVTTYQGNFDRQNPASWDTLARLAYGWASRKGTNPNATIMPVVPGNSPEVANGTADWLEQMNEPDKTWVGYNEYLNGADLGLAWSKGYDNNKVFSTSLGLKNADTAMKYSSSGLAVSNAAPMRGEDYWSKRVRGSRPKTEVGIQPMTWKARTFGWVDHPYDIIQFHNYAYTGGTNQFAGNVQSGLPLELSGSLVSAKEYNLFRNKYAPYVSLDVGEWGYDRSQVSVMNAPYIDNHHPEEVRAAWALRTMLIYNVHGIDYAQWYRLFGEHAGDDTTAGTQFETMSLLIDSLGDQQFVRLNYVGYSFAQFNEFGDYVYDSTLREDSVYCYRFKKEKKYMYAVWSVESSPNISNWKNEKAVFHERKGRYTLPFRKGAQVKIRKPQNYEVRMSSTTMVVPMSGLLIDYGLVPTFIEVLN